MGFTVITRKSSNSAGLTHHLKNKPAWLLSGHRALLCSGIQFYLLLLYHLFYILIYVLGYDTLIS